MNLEETLKLPMYDDELSELERIALLRQINAQERLAKKRRKAKVKFQESMEKVYNVPQKVDR